jgi:carbonic anhydrase
MSVAKEFEQANSQYVATFEKGDLAIPPARHVTVITCMDARIDPAAALGIKEGDAHVSPPTWRNLILTG